jgi:hypothetical protein
MKGKRGIRMAKANGNDIVTNELKDIAAASSGAAIGAVSVGVVAAALSAPAFLPITAALVGAALGYGTRRMAVADGTHRNNAKPH